MVAIAYARAPLYQWENKHWRFANGEWCGPICLITLPALLSDEEIGASNQIASWSPVQAIVIRHREDNLYHAQNQQNSYRGVVRDHSDGSIDEIATFRHPNPR